MTFSKTPVVVTQVVSGDLWAGAEVQVYSLCKALVGSSRIRITAVLFNEGVLSTKLRELGMDVELADESQLNAIEIIGIIRKHCRRHKTRLLHTHGFKENILGVIGKDLARVPYSVRTVHGNPETALTLKTPQQRVINKLDLILGRTRQQAIVAVSSQLEDTLRLLFPRKVHKIFNFVDVKSIRNEWPKASSTYEGPPRIGIIGRLVPVKRVDLFLRAIALLNQRGLACTGVVIGSGPLESELKRFAKSLGIADKIDFKGFINPAFDELRKLDALMMTSDHEGLPLTLLEALALEVPVIAHRVGGIPEVLDNGECGWLVWEQTSEAYAEVTATALGAKTELQDRSKKGVIHVTKTFGIQSNTRKYEELYTKKTTK